MSQPPWPPPGQPASQPPPAVSPAPLAAPPPGWPTAASPWPTYGPPPLDRLGYHPGLLHKPGVVALRPLGLGDIYDAAFKTIRRNPKAMVGLAALVMVACAVVPAVISIVLAASDQLRLLPNDLGGALAPASPATALAGVAEVYGAIGLGDVLTALGQIVLTGMVAQVLFGAVLGRATSMSEAWTAVRPRFWRLVGLTLLGAIIAAAPFVVVLALAIAIGVAGSTAVGVVVGVLGGLAAVVWFVVAEVRLVSLSTPALVIERLGVLAALRRTWRLTRRQFWRIFGISLLTVLIVGIAGQILSIPFGIVAGVLTALAGSSSWGGFGVVASNLLSSVVVGAITTPFSAAVMALLYLDQRIRKEGYDVELIAAAQSDGPVVSAPMPRAHAGE